MISVTDPIQRSIDATKALLFAPFDLARWCVLGFTAFLASFVAGGGLNLPSSNPVRGFRPSRGRGLDLERMGEAWAWILAHLALMLVLAGILLAVFLVVMWLGARGQFMFLDNVVGRRARVAEPWNRYRAPANGVFLLLVALKLALLAVVAGGGYLGWSLAGPDLLEQRFGLPVLEGILAALAVIGPLGFVLAMTGQLLRDFVIPIMYLRGVSVGAGFGVLFREVIPGHGGSFVLFYLMKLVLALAASIVILFGTCITCCIAGLPYVSAVVFLPISVFFRTYPLAFMAQVGPQWVLEPH